MHTILLVEDDQSLGYILTEYLELHGFRVMLAKDGEVGLKIFNMHQIDLCILDVMLPKKDGFTLAAEIKQSDEKMPLIFLTSKSLKIDKLKGFKLGGDDYIVKPVDEEELIARVDAVMKRARPSTFAVSANQYKLGSYIFDPSRQELTFKNRKQIITVREAAVLKLLCERKGQILERKVVLKQLWGENNYFTRRSMDVFVSHLRKYLSDDPAIEIKNIHGKGYILNC
jgi:DNA-binding response OmpR family regulator